MSSSSSGGGGARSAGEKATRGKAIAPPTQEEESDGDDSPPPSNPTRRGTSSRQPIAVEEEGEEEEEEGAHGDRSRSGAVQIGSAKAVGSRVQRGPFLDGEYSKHGSGWRWNAKGYEEGLPDASLSDDDAKPIEEAEEQEELPRPKLRSEAGAGPEQSAGGSDDEMTAEQIAAGHGIRLSGAENGSDSIDYIDSDELEEALRVARTLADDLSDE
jgi:hypothetical protein